MVEEFAFDNTEERRKVRNNGTGWVEVIAGSMFSGKSEELIRRLNRARIARQKVQVFKPAIDARYSIEEIASHSGQKSWHDGKRRTRFRTSWEDRTGSGCGMIFTKTVSNTLPMDLLNTSPYPP